MNIKRVQILLIYWETWACASCNCWLISPAQKKSNARRGSERVEGNPLKYISPEIDNVQLSGCAFFLIDSPLSLFSELHFNNLSIFSIFYRLASELFLLFFIFRVPPALVQRLVSSRYLRLRTTVVLWDVCPLSLSELPAPPSDL